MVESTLDGKSATIPYVEKTLLNRLYTGVEMRNVRRQHHLFRFCGQLVSPPVVFTEQIHVPDCQVKGFGADDGVINN